jgi:orotidine-5'-phosphate decarboxylase
MSNFADKVAELVRKKKSPLVAGIDPALEAIPDFLKRDSINPTRSTVDATVEVLVKYCTDIIDAVYEIVPGVKPNIAFFEKFGPAGLEAYARVIDYASDHDLFVIGDVKRGDIGNTSKHYAEAYMGEVELIDGTKFSPYNNNIDGITINVYFGTDSTQPFLDFCSGEDGKGAIILCKTSNPGSKEIQDLFVDDSDVTVCEKAADLIREWGSKSIGGSGYSGVSAVVGATSDNQVKYRKRMPNNIFLLPGYGAQGATADDVVPSFDDNGDGALVNAARSVMYAFSRKPWNESYTDAQYKDAARASALDATEKIVGALKREGKGKIFS